MPRKNCDECFFRAKYDNNPKSIIGKIWRWHIGWCPGWKSYIKSLTENEREDILKKYDLSRIKRKA